MKLTRMLFRRGWGVAGCLLLAGLLWTGCRTNDEAIFNEVAGYSATGAATGSNAAPGQATSASSIPGVSEVERFSVGDLVMVTFSGLNPSPPEHNERIKEDGTITLPLIGGVKAEGKSAGELQQEIHDLYVPKYYKRMTVTVKAPERTYTVSGEVRAPGPKYYSGRTTVTKAIAAAGGFTDFANKKKVRLTRGDKTITVNCVKAEEDPRLDPVVIPNDKIHVKRRFL